MRSNLAMVALRSTDPIDWTAITADFGVKHVDITLDPQSSTVAAATFAFPGGVAGLGHMPVPIPWGDLEWPVQTAWQWPAAEAELRTHAAHVVVFVSSSELSSVELNLQLVRLVASVIATSPAAGVYYGHASVVVEPQRYVEEARTASVDHLPISLWLGLHPVRDDGGLSVYTTGMEIFGLLNLEAHDTDTSPGALLDLLANVAHYEISAGIQIGDGETIRGSQNERVEVRHRASRFGDGSMSCQLLLR